jgi:calcium channel MID1
VHAILNTPPLFGDTTSSQSLLLSPPFIAPPLPYPIPTFPNYTLPPANLSIPSSPPSSLSPSHFLVLTLTSVPLPLNKSACALRLVVPPNITSQELILRDDDGWRTQFIVEKLTPSTNYTAYVLVNDTMISGPIYFTTKSGTSSLILEFAILLTRRNYPSNIPVLPRSLLTVLPLNSL